MNKSSKAHQLRYQLNAIQKRLTRAKESPELFYKLQQWLLRLMNRYHQLLSAGPFKKTVISLAIFLGISLPQKSTAQNIHFIKTSGSELGLNTVSGFYLPAFIDIDGDGDLDVHGISYNYSGNYETSQMSFVNAGGAESPSFDPLATVFSVPVNQDEELHTFKAVDIDGDGDSDIMANESYYGFYFVENIGTQSNPQFAEPSRNAFGLENLSADNLGAYFDFGDIDDDGDLDIITEQWDDASETYVNVVFENRGTSEEADFLVTQALFEFDLNEGMEFTRSSSWMDVDMDGDLDIVQCSYGITQDTSLTEYFSLFWVENIGTPQDLRIGNKRLLPGSAAMEDGYFARCLIADLDADGDQDILAISTSDVGYYTYETEFILFENDFFKSTETIPTENISVFPNPTSDRVQVSGIEDIKSITLKDLAGKTLLHEYNTSFLDVSSIHSGLYFLEIIDNQGGKGVKKIHIHRP